MKTKTIKVALAEQACIALVLMAPLTPAGATIIYGTPQQALYFNTEGDLSFDVDVTGASPDFELISSRLAATAGLAPQGDNRILTTTGPNGLDGYSWIPALPVGYSIGTSLDPAQTWYGAHTDPNGQALIGLGPYGACESYFLNDTPPYDGFTAYAGIDLFYDGDHHYGWMRISDPYPPIFMAGEILDWAYESSPNTPILAGAVPEPVTTVLFGLGAVLLATCRRRRCMR